MEIDREKAGLSGASVEDVAHALVMATASTRFANLNYWVDVKTGFDYLVQIQIPPLRMDKPEDIETLPLRVGQPSAQPPDPRCGQRFTRECDPVNSTATCRSAI